MAQIITSQDHINDAIVAAKIAAKDFEIFVSPAFSVDGCEYQVLLDGHHSLAAAIKAGADYSINIMTASEHDAIALLNDNDIDGFLDAAHMGSDYRNAITGKYVW